MGSEFQILNLSQFLSTYQRNFSFTFTPDGVILILNVKTRFQSHSNSFVPHRQITVLTFSRFQIPDLKRGENFIFQIRITITSGILNTCCRKTAVCIGD